VRFVFTDSRRGNEGRESHAGDSRPARRGISYAGVRKWGIGGIAKSVYRWDAHSPAAAIHDLLLEIVGLEGGRS